MSNERASTEERSRKRVGILTPWNQECGLATYARFFVSEFDENTYTVFSETEEARVKDDEHFVVRCWQRERDSYADLIQAVSESDIGVLHINGHYRFFVYPSFGSCLQTLREQGVKVVLTLHSAFTRDDALSELLLNVDRVLVHTPEVRLETIACGASPEKVEVVPHGVLVKEPVSDSQKAALRQRLSMPANEKIIVASGFVQPHKGLDGVLSAVLGLQQAGVNAQGYIAGKPNESDPNSKEYLRQLKELAANAGIADRIHFLDRFLADDELTDYLQAADLVLMNYQSQYYEASGACSLALGAGALVATSIAPPFATFGDAVWHITAGYPADLSAYLLLTNDSLVAEIKNNASVYCEQNSWAAIKEKLIAVYRSCGVEPTASPMKVQSAVKETAKETQIITGPAITPVGSRLASAIDSLQRKGDALQPDTLVEKTDCKSPGEQNIRVLLQNRSNALTQPGGDTIVMRRTIEALEQNGIEVVLDLEGRQNPADFDIVHLYNFAIPRMIDALGRRAFEANTPFVVTTLCEDAPAYRNQAMTMAGFLMDYVAGGQDRDWYRSQHPALESIPAADSFANDWVIAHAASLLTNGREESRVLQREYGAEIPVSEVQLGFDFKKTADPELFIREFGVRDFVLCVGRLEFRKNQLMLLKALEDSDVTVVLAAGGFSYDMEYTEAVKNFNRRGRTIITQRLSHEMLASAYAAASVHALPSWYELPGLVSLEAAHHGCGVVATLFGTAADYLGEAAYYCDPANPDSVRKAVEEAMAQPNTEKLKKRVAEFTWESMGERTIEVYKEVLGLSSANQKEIEAVETKDIEQQEVSNAVQPVTLDSGGYDFAPGTVEFQELLERGELAAKQKEYNLAHDLLFRAEKLNPQSVRVLRARGAVYLAENQAVSARRYFERAFELDALDPKTLSGLGMCYMHDKETRKAYECFVKALAEAPDSLIAILQLLDCSYALDRFDDLVRALRAYLELHPADDEMRFCLAGALFKQGMLREAKEMIRVVLQGTPEHTGAMQLDELIEEAVSGTTAYTPSVEASVIDGAVETETAPEPIAVEQTVEPDMELEAELAAIEELKRNKELAFAFDRVSKLIEDRELTGEPWERAHCLKAELVVLTGDMPAAVQLFDEVLQHTGSSARALAGKGAIAATAAQWEEAEQLFKQSIALNAEYDVAFAGLGLCAAARENLPAAWTYYMQALESNPENMRALLGVLEIGYPMKRFAEIETVLQKYIELHPGDTEFLYSLAGCYYVQGKVEGATQELQRLLLLDPSHEGAGELLKMIEQRSVAETDRGM